MIAETQHRKCYLKRVEEEVQKVSTGLGTVSYEPCYWRDPKGYELIWVLPERRNNPERINK